MLSLQKVTVILERWGIRYVDILPHELVPGSPERALARTVVGDSHGRRYVLEQLAPDAYEGKNLIAARIDRLHQRGLPLSPYLKGENDQWVQHHSGFCWQLAPFLEGIPLDRNRYWQDGWRGEAIGHFLADLSTATRHWERKGDIFSLSGYIEDLTRQIERHNPEALPGIEPVADFLRRRFCPLEEDLPSAFCHGDPHPLNTIWGVDRINAVIDWEFCGWKPRLYDAALVVGCVGAEAPAARQASFIAAFLDTLRDRRIYSKEEFALLPLFVLAVRFGWLSEWLRKKDAEMIEFEIFYMNLLKTSCIEKV